MNFSISFESTKSILFENTSEKFYVILDNSVYLFYKSVAIHDNKAYAYVDFLQLEGIYNYYILDKVGHQWMARRTFISTILPTIKLIK